MTVRRESRDGETLRTVSCPRCGAKRGYPCVYVLYPYSSQQKHQVGTPTREPHLERRDRAYQRRKSLERAQPLPRPHPYVQAELDERVQLARWLRLFGRILTGKG